MSWVHHVARLAAPVLLACGLVALGFAAYVVIGARVYQATERRRFERARQDAAEVSVVAGAARSPVIVLPTPVDGSSIGEIQIPRLGLSAMVAQGESAPILQHAVGHLADTALPGQPGNVVLAGHRDTFFRPLKRVRVGDTIILNTRDGDFEYLVESTSVVPPSDLRVLGPTGGRTLTLITCYPFSYVGAAPDRFIVRARAAALPVSDGRRDH